MKGLIKVANEFRASDAILDPPAARDEEERRIQKGRGLAGVGIGSAIGTALGSQVYPDKRALGTHRLGLSGAGFIAGGALGDAAANYGIYKKRQRNDEPMKDEALKRELREPNDPFQLPKEHADFP